MFHKIFSSQSLWLDSGLLLTRLITGAFMIYHGWEVFDNEKMEMYTKWLVDDHFPAPAFEAYLGKTIELLAGISLFLGLLTRFMMPPMAIAMSIVAFGIGHGKIFTDDQHPFLFVVLAMGFFFTGPGKYSIDELILGKKGSS